MSTLASTYFAHFQGIIPSRPRFDYHPEAPTFYGDFTRFSRAVFYDTDPAEEIDIFMNVGLKEQRGPFDDEHEVESYAEEETEEEVPSIEEKPEPAQLPAPVRPAKRGGKQMIRMMESDSDSSSDSDSDSDDEEDSDDDEAASVAPAHVQVEVPAVNPAPLVRNIVVNASAPVVVVAPSPAPVAADSTVPRVPQETGKQLVASRRAPQKKKTEEGPKEGSKKPTPTVNPVKKPRQPKENPKKKVTKKPAAPRKAAVPRRGKKSFDPLPTAASFSSDAFDPRLCAVAPIRRRGSEATLKRSASEGITAMAMEKKMKIGGF